ncbi:cyclic nucleotide-binding-like protein [Cladochytrium replicatum]|nr:cyclic nucleotide-binding-like protein [Cladochytrium replicatum]
MHNGHFFGEVGILLDMKRTASIKAKTTCHLFKLTKDSVLDCCKQSSELQAKFKAAADERYALYEKRMATQNDTQTGSKPENKIEQFDLEVTEQNLRKLQIFRNVEDCTLKELALLMERSDIETGQIIIQCGETAESMYFLASGRVVIISEFGDELDTADGPYAWFGEVAILEQVPRTATVKAISKCSVFELKRGSLLELLEKDPTIAEQLRESSLSRLQKYLMRNVLA